MDNRALAGIRWIIAVLAAVILAVPLRAQAIIDGVTGTTFSLTVKEGYISTPDGNSIFMWGYALNNGGMQYPGPTLIVRQGDTVTVQLSNTLTVPVSIVFPGQSVSASGGGAGLITQEAPAGGSVTYTFTASKPGTYTYYSGTRSDLQVEMGLVGALIVRPSGYDENTNRIAYDHADSKYDHEYLFLLSEIDPRVHERVEEGKMDQADTTDFLPVYWLINGRAAPDTMVDSYVPWLPTQPYSCLPVTRPGETVLIRMIGAGRDLHPLHTHGNHHRIIAQDGRLLSSAPGSGADLSRTAFTTSVAPGSTVDALWSWTGERVGWDVYGHKPEDSLAAGECPKGLSDPGCDHGKSMPVQLPDQLALTFGQFYSGSPFLGTLGALPPGEGGFNPTGGYTFMWHSHNEKELTNFDIFPGGMLTMMVVVPPATALTTP